MTENTEPLPSYDDNVAELEDPTEDELQHALKPVVGVHTLLKVVHKFKAGLHRDDIERGDVTLMPLSAPPQSITSTLLNGE